MRCVKQFSCWTCYEERRVLFLLKSSRPLFLKRRLQDQDEFLEGAGLFLINNQRHMTFAKSPTGSIIFVNISLVFYLSMRPCFSLKKKCRRRLKFMKL
jgi:hypothetical protein